MIANLQIEELGNRGFALAMQMLGRRDDAADAVQDALHQLVRKWRSFDAERGELTSWFLKIVRNRCVDLIRQRARRHTEPAELEQITEHICSESLRDFVINHLKTCYFVLRAVGDTGLESYLG